MISFFLGSHPAISKAELRSLLNTVEVFANNSVAFFDISPESAAAVFKMAGGTPRYGEVVGSFDTNSDDDALLDILKNSLEKEKKREYVLSLYGYRVDKKDLHMQLKKQLSGTKYDGNFGEAQHSPAAVGYVLSRGGHEYSVMQTPEKVYVMKTIASQDPSYWSMVDIDRPGRNMKIGMLPSKLARIMVNLAAVPVDGTIWDPFVGQGTIGMQAAVLGVRTYGTDKANQSILHAKDNISWMKSKGFFTHDMVTLREVAIEKAHSPGNISAFVTEPFLGKPHFKPFANEQMAKREWFSIEKLFRVLFQLAEKTLRKGQRIVVVKPTFAFIAEKGVQWYNPPLTTPAGTLKVPEILKDLGVLEWRQHDSVVGREIIVLEKN